MPSGSRGVVEAGASLVTLTPDDWITVKEAAAYLHTSTDSIYQNAERYGAVRLSDTPRGRLRFKRSLIDRALGVEPVAHQQAPPVELAADTPPAATAKRRRTSTTPVELLHAKEPR
jgi:hypothetical protein